VAARERILFLTGRLAAPRLEAVLKGMKDAGFDWRVHDIGVKVAALMTAAIITRRLPAPIDATRVIVPGRCRLDLDALAAHYGVPFQRGPYEINDLPAHFGRGGGPPDLSRHDIRIFSEIVEAPDLPVERILERARAMRAEGADVIDVGCQPGVGFPHLEDTVRRVCGLTCTISTLRMASSEHTPSSSAVIPEVSASVSSVRLPVPISISASGRSRRNAA
jgi:Family of unknown function (DUF6513)